METNASTRTAWEKEIARKYRIDWEKDRDFFGLVWETDDVFHSLEDFDACAEAIWPIYVRVKERLVQFGRQGGPEDEQFDKQGDYKPVEPMRGLGERTVSRIVAFSEYLAKIAACNKRVMHLRERICGGVARTLSSEKALEFLEAHSVEDAKVLIGHESTLLWPDGSISGRFFRDQEGSVLGDLLDTAKYLEKHYPWGVGQAARFVLCGDTPRAGVTLGKQSKTINSGVSAHMFNRATITLEVDSWVPADEVRKAYLNIQHRVYSDDFSSVSLPQGLRKHPSPRNLEVFRFVVAQSTVQVINAKERLGRLELPSWRDLMRRWNDSLSAADDPRHYSNPRNFQRDFKRAQRAVIGTDWGLPGVPGVPKSAAEAKRRGEDMLNFCKGAPDKG